MPQSEQKFNASFAKEAEWKAGARSFLEYRDLGIKDATGGAFNAHVIRMKRDAEHGLRTTGLHRHDLTFQMFYVLKGWIRFHYEDRGEFTFEAGDCCLQPPGIVHDELECSDDLELIEITSPAEFKTTALPPQG